MPPIDDEVHAVDRALWAAARGLLVLNVVLLLVLWLFPMPDPLAVPGRAPRAVVGQ